MVTDWSLPALRPHQTGPASAGGGVAPVNNPSWWGQHHASQTSQASHNITVLKVSSEQCPAMSAPTSRLLLFVILLAVLSVHIATLPVLWRLIVPLRWLLLYLCIPAVVPVC